MTVPVTAKGEATRAHLLRTAATVFAERGYTATTQNDLIAAAGLTKGAFYFYFKSKLDLALAVIADQKSRLLTGIAERVAGEPTAAGQLRAMLPAMLDQMASDPASWSVVRLTKELAGDAAVAERVAEPMAEWIAYLAEVIRRGQAEGDVRGDVDADEVAQVLVATVDGLKSLSGVIDTPEVAAERFAARADTMLALVERALFT